MLYWNGIINDLAKTLTKYERMPGKKFFIFPPRFYANCVSTTLTVLILHNVESVYFFYSNPVRLTPDASSDRVSSKSVSRLQKHRSVCYTRLGSKTLDYHYHTAMAFMAAYLSPTRPLLDPELKVDLNLYYRQNAGTGSILRDNVYGNSCRSSLAHFLTSMMPLLLPPTSLWPRILSCLDMWFYVLHWARITCKFWSTSCADHLVQNPQNRQ
jgi:hypothetical protein